MIVRLGRIQISARLIELLIHFWRFDVREQLAGIHASADVHIPLLQISIRARVDRGIRESLDVAGKNDFRLRRAKLRMNHGNSGNRQIVGLFTEIALRLSTAG